MKYLKVDNVSVLFTALVCVDNALPVRMMMIKMMMMIMMVMIKMMLMAMIKMMM